jgi:hypothetical protein
VVPAKLPRHLHKSMLIAKANFSHFKRKDTSLKGTHKNVPVITFWDGVKEGFPQIESESLSKLLQFSSTHLCVLKMPSAKQVGQEVTRILEVLRSKLGWSTCYRDFYCGFPQSLQANARIMPQSGHSRFLSFFFQYIIIYILEDDDDEAPVIYGTCTYSSHVYQTVLIISC